MATISQDENAPQDDLPQTFNRAILATALRDGLTWIVDRQDDCEELRTEGFPATYLLDGAQLSKRVMQATNRLIVLQRPGPEGAGFGLRVKAEIERQRWRGTLTRCSPPDPFFDLATVARETGPERFGPFIASLAAEGIDDVLGRRRCLCAGREEDGGPRKGLRGAGRVVTMSDVQSEAIRCKARQKYLDTCAE
jgi:hypothetical protein